jgi:High potential iron-sulfur protein
MFSRRDWIKGLLALPAVVGFARSGLAQTTKVPQKVAQYQDKPKDGHHCELCKYFIPGKSATADGTCRLVAGSIDPDGWCMLFAPKA